MRVTDKEEFGPDNTIDEPTTCWRRQTRHNFRCNTYLWAPQGENARGLRPRCRELTVKGTNTHCTSSPADLGLTPATGFHRLRRPQTIPRTRRDSSRSRIAGPPGNISDGGSASRTRPPALSPQVRRITAVPGS